MLSEWEQITSSLEDSSQYSSWSQRGCSLDGLWLSSYFQVLLSLYQSLGDCTSRVRLVSSSLLFSIIDNNNNNNNYYFTPCDFFACVLASEV